MVIARCLVFPLLQFNLVRMSTKIRGNLSKFQEKRSAQNPVVSLNVVVVLCSELHTRNSKQRFASLFWRALALSNMREGALIAFQLRLPWPPFCGIGVPQMGFAKQTRGFLRNKTAFVSFLFAIWSFPETCKAEKCNQRRDRSGKRGQTPLAAHFCDSPMCHLPFFDLFASLVQKTVSRNWLSAQGTCQSFSIGQQI